MHLHSAKSTSHIRVAVVCPTLAKYDAIAASGRDTYVILSRESELEVQVLTYRNDYKEVPARAISGLCDLLLDKFFQAADVIIYHFGIYCELFDALIATKGRALQIVVFHNVTPAQYVAQKDREIIERSFRQVHNLSYADEIWADSSVNLQALKALGIETPIRIVPLAVQTPARKDLCGKLHLPINMLFVGRFVQSKGALDALKAVDWVHRRSKIPFRLRLVGNMEWSDKSYVEQVTEDIAARNLSSTVHMLGTVSPDVLQELYHMSHMFLIPSYHEGFCKPVIEALRAGCIPLGYDAYNLSPISNGLGRMVPTGDIHALGMAVQELVEGLAGSTLHRELPLLPLDRGMTSARGFDESASRYVQDFSFDRVASITLERLRALCRGSESHSAESWQAPLKALS